jgi:Reeler domain
MKKYSVYIFIVSLCSILMYGMINGAIDKDEMSLKSSGSHQSSTGAPGEKTCTQSGCHGNSFIQQDDSTNTFQFGEKSNTLYSDDTVGIKLTVRKAGTTKFGFQIVCLDSMNKNAGTFVIYDGVRIQSQNADDFVPTAKGRKYLTHTYQGNKAIIPGEIEWTFSWIPPQNGYKGKVTFYMMSNCSNNDQTSSGDKFYSSKFSANYQQVSSVQEKVSYPVNTISVLYNRNSQSFETVLPIHDEIRDVYCFDLVGNTYQLQCQEKSLDGFCQLSMPMQKQIFPGFYGIRAILSNGSVYTGTSIVY